MEDLVVSPASLITIGFPALQRSVVDLGNDASRGLELCDPVIGRLWWCGRGRLQSLCRLISSTVDTDTVDISDGQLASQAILRVGLPQAHHVPLCAQNAGVGTRQDLRRGPEEVVTGRILFQRLDAVPVLEVRDRLVDKVIGVRLGHDLANDAYTIATEIPTEARRLCMVLNVGELDGGYEMGTEALDMLDFCAEGANDALPAGFELCLVALDEVALDASETRRQRDRVRPPEGQNGRIDVGHCSRSRGRGARRPCRGRLGRSRSCRSC